MKKITLFIFVQLILNSKAFAGCSPVNLTDPDYLKSIGKENLIEHFTRPRDQDSVGWCAAYSSSDAISFAVGEPVSALDITINYHASKLERPRDATSDTVMNQGMVVADVMKNVSLNGYCPESEIASNQTYSSNVGNYAMNEFLTYFQDYVKRSNGGSGYIDNCANCSEAYINKYIKPRIPGATLELVNEVVRKNNGDGLSSLKELMIRACGDKRKLDTPLDVVANYSGPPSKYISQIEDALDSNKMPEVSINTRTFANDGAVLGGHGPHAMVVIGKRMGSNGKCEYQIRNSWGRSCSYYTPEVKRSCDEKKGTFWLSEDQMASNLIEVTVVSKKGEKKKREVPNRLEAERQNNNSNDNQNNNQKNNQNNNTINRDHELYNSDFPFYGTNNNNANNNKLPEQMENFFASVGNFFQNLFTGIGNFVTNFWSSMKQSFNY